VAYFLIGVLVPVAMLSAQGQLRGVVPAGTALVLDYKPQS